MNGTLKILLFTLLFMSISIYGCSTSEDTCEDHHFDNIQLASNSHTDIDDYLHWDDGRKSLTFYDDDNFGDHVRWKVVLEDGEIVKLYKDGRRLSQSEIEDNEDYIYEKLDEIEDSMKDLQVDLERLEDELADMDFNFNFDFEFDDENFSMNMSFDEDAFEESMEQLSKALGTLKSNKYSHNYYDDDWEWDDSDDYWDKKEFKREMKKLKRELRDLEDLDVEIDFDMDEFNEGMKEFSESMKDIKVNMSGFDDEMLNLKIELKGLKKEMKKLKGFMHEMSADLEWEGYIDDADDGFELELNEDEMIVDGTRLPDKLHRKYLKMYEKHFGKELEDGITMHR